MNSSVSQYADKNLSFSGCDMVVSVGITLPNGEKYDRVIGSLQTITYSVHMDKFPVRSLGNVNAKDYTFGPRTIAGSLIFAVFNKHVAHEILEQVKKAGNLGQYHLMMDELPPFNITISYANEYGVTARMAIYGIRIINEGKTMSVNDIYTENTYQFVATDIEYLNNSTGATKGALMETVKDVVATRSFHDIKPIPTNNAPAATRNVSVDVKNRTAKISKRSLTK